MNLVYPLPLLYIILIPFTLYFVSFLFHYIVYIYIYISLYYVIHSFNKEKYSFLLSFHMVSESWKARGKGFAVFSFPATHLGVMFPVSHPTRITSNSGTLYRHQNLLPTGKIIRQTFLVTAPSPTGDSITKCVDRRAFTPRSSLRSPRVDLLS